MLIPVRRYKSAAAALWVLLQERPAIANISHLKMPTWDEHKAFIKSEPYAAWFLIEAAGEIVGSIYLTHNDEIGVFVFQKSQGKGYARGAVRDLMKAVPRDRYLANIAPGNSASIGFFKELGFTLTQETYEFHA